MSISIKRLIWNLWVSFQWLYLHTPKKAAGWFLTHCDPEKSGVPILSELSGSCNEKPRSHSPALQLAVCSPIFNLRDIPGPTQAEESYLTREGKAKNTNEWTKSAFSSVSLLTFYPAYLVICLAFPSEDKKWT